ncbi:MAG: Hpt domain-containing protein [Duganella sp.]
MTPYRYQSIDPAVLMEAAGDQSTFITLSHTFLEHAPGLFARLQQAFARRDYPAVAASSHALKGMAMLIGASGLATQLQRHETAARQGGGLDAAQEELAPLLALVMREVTQSIVRAVPQRG